MPKVDLLVKAPHVFTMQGAGVGYRADSAMAVDRGKIVAMGPQDDIAAQYQAERVINGDHHTLLPGFIDAHIHGGECILRGLAQDTGYWMMYGVGPFEVQLDEAASRLGFELALIEGIRAGTTTFGEYSRTPEALCGLMQKAGVRGLVTVTIREAVKRIYEPGELYEFDPGMGRECLAQCLQLYDRWHNRGDGRFNVLFGPQGADFLSTDLLLEVRRQAIERDTRIHLHLQQGDRETAQTMQRYGKRPIAFLDELGYLDKHLLGVHLTDADEQEAALVARRGASMVLCSGSIGIIDGVVPPAKAFQDAGGYVALGSDQAPGNNNHNLLNEMKLTALFNKIRYTDPEVMPAWRVLRMATIEGARAIGLEDRIGSLETGKRADFILIDLHKPTMMPLYEVPMRNIVPNLVYSARGDEVSLVAVDGRVIFENDTLLTLDEAGLLRAVQAKARDLGERATPEFERINGTNAAFMREGKL